MSEPMQVWVARDRAGLFPLALYGAERPRLIDERYWGGAGRVLLPTNWFPNLKSGECRRMLLVDAPEAGEAS